MINKVCIGVALLSVAQIAEATYSFKITVKYPFELVYSYDSLGNVISDSLAQEKRGQVTVILLPR